MRTHTTIILGILALTAVTGCEKRTRTKNSSSGSALFEEQASTATNVYRFAGVEQSLTDARNAVKEENWAQAVAATDALLKQQPNNTEARALNTQAKLEGPMLVKFTELNKAVAANEVGVAMRHFKGLSDASMYHERAQALMDKMKTTVIENQLTDARAHNRAGRCDEARRVARVTTDWYPDARDRLEEAVAGCRPVKTTTTASVTPSSSNETARSEEPPAKPAAVAMAATVPSAPIGLAAPEKEREKAPEPKTGEPPASKPAAAAFGDRTLAAALPAAAPSTVRTLPSAPPVAPKPEAAPTLVPTAPKIVPAAELETLRLAGDREPSLPAGAKMIMKRDNVKKISVAVKVCVSEQGSTTSVKLVKSSDYGDANEKILSDIRKWRFRPYMSNGVAIPVCTATLLTYQLQ